MKVANKLMLSSLTVICLEGPIKSAKVGQMLGVYFCSSFWIPAFFPPENLVIDARSPPAPTEGADLPGRGAIPGHIEKFCAQEIGAEKSGP